MDFRLNQNPYGLDGEEFRREKKKCPLCKEILSKQECICFQVAVKAKVHQHLQKELRKLGKQKQLKNFQYLKGQEFLGLFKQFLLTFPKLIDVTRVSGDSYSNRGTRTTQKVHKIKLYIGSNCCVKRAYFQHDVTGESWLTKPSCSYMVPQEISRTSTFLNL